MSANYMLLTATVTTGIQSGRYYRTRYRAKNEVGFGPYSDVTYILAATIPQQPTTISVSITGDQVTIMWQMPYNSGSLIYQAQIEIQQLDGTFTEDVSNCDGSAN
jgi:hypothetical protein